MANFEQYCRLCLKVASDEHCEEINHVTWNILDVLLLKVNSEDGNTHVMCDGCLQKLIKAFKFKSMCLYTDNTIISYVDDETGYSVDLREIYVKDKINNQPIEKLHDLKVCRLCMQQIMGNFTSVHELEADALDNYIPEINFGMVTDAIICTQCFDSVCSHSSFIRNCLAAQEKIKDYFDNNVPYSPPRTFLNSCRTESIKSNEHKEVLMGTVVKSENENEDWAIKTESIDIKSEDTDGERDTPLNFSEATVGYYNKKHVFEDSGEMHDECVDQHETDHNKTPFETLSPKSEYREELEDDSTHKGVPKMKKYNGSERGYRTNLNRNLTEHQLVQNDTLEVRLCKCDVSSYYCNLKGYLKKGDLKHKNSEIQVYRCDTCSPESKQKPTVKRHQLIHKDSFEVQMYKCDKCNFETKHRNALRGHLLVHKDPSEVQMYKCVKCSFETKHRESLKVHVLVHNDPSEVHMYKCDKCSFETKHRKTFVRHMLVHKDPSEVQMHKCDRCSFETKRRNRLRRHLLVHKDPSEVQMYKCVKCNFETKHRESLKVHMLVHNDPSEVHMYKCDKCSFETKRKNALIRHLLVHKDPSEVQMYKCDNCSFQTKRKNTLIGHLLVHKDPSEVQMCKCDKCSYETKHRDALKRHLLVHNDLSEVQIYKCIICNYTSKYKNFLTRHRNKHNQ